MYQLVSSTSYQVSYSGCICIDPRIGVSYSTGVALYYKSRNGIISLNIFRLKIDYNGIGRNYHEIWNSFTMLHNLVIRYANPYGLQLPGLGLPDISGAMYSEPLNLGISKPS